MLNRIALIAVASASCVGAAAPAQAQDTIKIGEINSYKAQPAFLEPYKKGWELAVEEVNAAGGVLGRKLEVISRDDNGNPGDAVRVAEELVSRENVRADRRHVPVEHRPRGHRLRQAEEGVLPRRRAAHRQDHLAERQPLHLPPAAQHLHAVGDAGARGGQAEEEALGHRLPELRVRPVGDGDVQGDAEEGASPTSSSSPSRRRRSARSTPARWCRRSPTPSPTRSSTCCSAPTCRSSCARATRAACSRAARSSAC